MKRSLLLLLLCCSGALGQSPTATVPQSDQDKIFNAVTTAQTSGCLQNQGQNVWISNYTVSSTGATLVDYRLEYSYDSDSATCTTGTWFAFSDDATDMRQGIVVGIGAYPFVRANLVAYAGSGKTFTSFYTVTSAAPGKFYGIYNPSQSVRKVVFSNANDGTTSTVFVTPPYGSTGGMLVAQDLTQNWGAGSSITVESFVGKENITVSPSGNYVLPTTASNAGFGVPSTPASSIRVTYAHGATTGGTFSLYYIFFTPGITPASAQPYTPANSESTSAVNTAVSVTITPPSPVASGDVLASVYVYSVSARCSAGSAQLIIQDTVTPTTIWSSGTTEVGTTTFRYQWNPGLNASLAVGDPVQIQLGTCGGGNTGTLDVQASTF